MDFPIGQLQAILCEHNFFWSTDIKTSLPRANAFPVSLAHHVPDTWACHKKCNNNVLKPLFVHLFWLLSVINIFGLQQPASGKVAIEVSEAVSQFSLIQKVPLGSTESHKPLSWHHLSGAFCRFCVLALWAFTAHTKNTPALWSHKAWGPSREI